MLVYVVDDEEIFGECLKRFVLAAEKDAEVKVFRNAVDAISEMSDEVPDMMFLDVLLDGPDGFTLLNEMASYDDTAKVPVVIVSSLDMPQLEDYGVMATLNKAALTPADVGRCLEQVKNGRNE